MSFRELLLNFSSQQTLFLRTLFLLVVLLQIPSVIGQDRVPEAATVVSRRKIETAGTVKQRIVGDENRPTASNGGRRMVRLRDSNVWISQHSFHFKASLNSETPWGQSLQGEAWVLLDRNVNSVVWTGDDRHVVYIRRRPNGYQLMVYSVADDDYSVLLTLPQASQPPELWQDSGDGFFLVTDVSVVRHFSLPIAASYPTFVSLDSVSVLYEAKKSEIEFVGEKVGGEVTVFEVDAAGERFEIILAKNYGSRSEPAE